MYSKNKTNKPGESKPKSYVVIRNGLRVSDSEFESREAAKSEYDHWNRIVTRWPDGSKLEIVELNSK